MAENKNSFIIYTDWKQDFEFLTDEEAGKLIKHLLRFASDENPTIENEDRLLQFAAQKMKAVMKKDLKKYEAVIQKRSEAGKKGGVNSGKSRTSKQDEANKANASTPKQNERVNDNVNDNVILLKKETKYVVDDEAENVEKISEFKNFLKTEKQIQMDRLRMAHKLTDEELDLKIDEFVEKKVSWGDDEKWHNTNDMAKNFEFWLNKYPKIQISSFKDWDKKQFFENINTSSGTVSKEVKQDFFNHYSQPTPSGEMLFQSFNAWDTKTRMKKWINSQNKFANVS
ncbi:DUF6291 domain-containing protein [Epilithonimonas xixisoli]|uniref:DUF6291 domain-containing protein n=1 Tax=Epilithonimonas xixisoli TaxID=1476462 RepID=A0A4R8IEX6_9FLAO|nr:DUF6291 domain-containing protein [Epilithonimonas xixisoli]TDX83954.1 hypothetical protein B0I22_1542 [Epilithonimonas xixisoli]